MSLKASTLNPKPIFSQWTGRAGIQAMGPIIITATVLLLLAKLGDATVLLLREASVDIQNQTFLRKKTGL
jgi:hypothetical protein